MAASKFKKVALDYQRRGWSIIPIRKRDKRPSLRWQEFQTERATEQMVKDWFKHRPEDNVGIVTGAVSGLVVLDVDPRHGGEDSLKNLEREHGPLPRTPMASTGGGGRHLYFAHPGGTIRNRVGIVPGIDLRGDGGCIVAPPSVHPSGNRYRWEKHRKPDKIELAPMPYWLQRMVSDTAQRVGHTLVYWRQLLKNGVEEGERNNTIASITGHLLWHGVDPDMVQELMLCWNRIRCKPPLDDDEVMRTVQNITHAHDRHEESHSLGK